MKGKIKRVMALLLSLIMVLTMLPATVFAATQYTVTVSASPAAGGTVRIVRGSITDATSVTVYDGNQIHVYAEPAEGYHFVRWVENGATVVNGSTPMEGDSWSDFIYNVYENRNFVAEFASDYCELTLSADPAAGGTVKTVNNTPSGTFNYNSIQNIYAAPNAGYKFVGWYENGQPATCFNSYTTYTDQDAQVHLLKDTTLVAKFEVDGSATPPAAPTNPRWDGYVAKWDAVDGAEEYELQLWRGSFGIFGTTTSNTQYDVSAYMAPGQTYSFSAYAIKGSERSKDATSAEITVPGSLGTISGIAWDEYTLSWNAVTNAVSYNVKLYKDGIQVATGNSVPATSYDFTSDIAEYGDGVYYAKVEADYYVFGNTMAKGQSGEITVGTPKIKIDTIEATLSVPVAGQNAGALTLTVPAGSNYTATIESVEGYADLTATTFAAGESYSGRILLTPNEGYRFADSATVQFDNVGYFSHMSTNTSTGAYEYAITFSCPGHGVAASISDVDFGTLTVGYSEVDAKNPTVTNSGTEVFQLSGGYAKVELTARDVTAFTCGWNSGGGAISVGGSSNSKAWVRPVTGLNAGTYTATLTLYYDYDGSGTDYDWEVMDTATVTLTVAEDEAVANKHTVSAEPAEGGTVWINSRGTTEVAIGSMAKAYAEANTGYKFVGWYENGTKVYEGTDYTISSKDPARNLVAKFASTNPDVYVGGVGMTEGDYLAVGANETSLTMPASGNYAYYNNGVLSLRNYSYNGVGYEYSEDLYAVIYAPKEITILLSSVNTLTQTESTYGTVIQLAKGGTFRGSNVSGGSAGELTVSGGQMGIYADSGDIVVNGGTLNISNCAYGLNSETYYEGSVVINDGTLNISATDFAIKAYNVDVNYGDVTARCTNTVTQYDANYYAICADYFSFDNCTPKASVNSTGSPLVSSFLFSDVPTYDYVALEPHFAVSFLVDGEVYDTKYAETGMTVTPPADPEVSGRRFLGWYTQTDEAFNFTTAITENVELYAEFGEPYKITDVSLSVTKPVSGNQPSYTVTLPDGVNYTHFIQEGFYKDEFWWDATAGKGLAESDTFISGHRYIVHVYLKAAADYAFPADEAEITANVESDESVILNTIGNYNQYLKVTFVLIAPNASVSGKLTGLDAGDEAWVYLYEEGLSEPAYEVKANDDGSYLITDVIPANYTVKVVAEGYEEESVGPVKVEGAAEYSFYMTKKAGGVTVSGVATSFLSDTDDITIALFAEGSATAAYTATVKGNTANYSIESVAAGTYTMKVSKANHITREYEVVVGTEAVELNVKICPKGDADCNGKVNIRDWNAVKAHNNETALLTGYAYACADTDGNGRVNIRDWNALKAHNNETAPLW